MPFVGPALPRLVFRTLLRLRVNIQEPAAQLNCRSVRPTGEPCIMTKRHRRYAIATCIVVALLAHRNGSSQESRSPRTLVVWGEQLEPPVLLQRVEPQFPKLSPRAHVGNTIIRAWIRENGTVDRIEVLLPRPFGISEAVVAAVRQWKFTPAKVKGVPVPVVHDIVVPYRASTEVRPNSR